MNDDLKSIDLMAVPNCSEGTDAGRIDRLVRTCAVPGVRVLDVHSDPDHDRTVITLAGTAGALVDAGVALALVAREVIDLREQRGVHPRVGALDVLPFVALDESRMPAAIWAANEAARRIAAEACVPCFLYGRAAGPGRERPAHFRHESITTMTPDFPVPDTARCQTPGGVWHRSGVTLVGARGPLIAWNMWLDDGDLDDARAIAAAVREGGRNGGLPGVRALGLACAGTGRVQVSMNIEDYRRTPLGDVVARVRSEAARRGRIIGASELVGLVPRDALIGTTPVLLGLPRFDPAQIIPED
jgi:glutamate formiminotransferase